jgi:hypothetical protein
VVFKLRYELTEPDREECLIIKRAFNEKDYAYLIG